MQADLIDSSPPADREAGKSHETSGSSAPKGDENSCPGPTEVWLVTPFDELHEGMEGFDHLASLLEALREMIDLTPDLAGFPEVFVKRMRDLENIVRLASRTLERSVLLIDSADTTLHCDRVPDQYRRRA